MNLKQVNIIWGLIVVVLLAIIVFIAVDKKDDQKYTRDLEQTKQTTSLSDSIESGLPTSQVAPEIATTEPANNDLYKDISDWKTYRSEKYRVTFQYPANIKIVNEEVLNENLGSKWFRLELRDDSVPEKPEMRFEVDGDGYGPFFPDIKYTITELNGGNLEISSRKLETSENSDDGQVLIMTNSITSYNTHWYNWFFRYNESGTDYEPLFMHILSTFQFLD